MEVDLLTDDGTAISKSCTPAINRGVFIVK